MAQQEMITPDLTPRQKQIAQLVAAGMSTKAIARETGLTTHTVKNYIAAAAERINVDGPPRYRLIVFILNAPD